jgi:hypothetical protein
MGLIKQYQNNGIRVNDPNNPGRIYMSGKGLLYPFRLRKELLDKIIRVREASNKQTEQMTLKANHYFTEKGIPIKLDYDTIQKNYTKGLVRERHISKAIRLEIERLQIDRLEVREFLKKLYNGRATAVETENFSALENEIRNNLLKAGSPAFVAEDKNAFLDIDEIIEIIIDSGGIPCYPALLDDSMGNYTDFEKDWDNMHRELTAMNIGCIELIPPRNSQETLYKFVKYFNERKYIITFGTEHNTPEMTNLTVSCRHNDPLRDYLLKITYKGSCVIAAHQHVKKFGVKSSELRVLEGGYLDENNKPKREHINEFAEYGNKIIKYEI